MGLNDHQRERWPIDKHGFNALDMQSAAELGECYACIVGVWTGPNSHSPGCELRTLPREDRAGLT
jgi:hypothetical protein